MTAEGDLVEFGVNILNFGAGTSAEVVERWVRLAEDGPFGFAMFSDHVALTRDVVEQYPGPFWDPLSAIAWAAGSTERIRLGTTVLIPPYRHPLLTARMLANIDQLSHGRLIVGVGVGWARQEYAALGADFAARGAVTDEHLRALITLWSSDHARFDGEHFTIPEVDTRPRPRQQPHPPIWVGGTSAGALRRTVRYGQAWHPLRFPAGWLRRDGLPLLRKAADAEGMPLPALAPRILLAFSDERLPDEHRACGQGHPDQVKADLAELAELGVTEVLLDTHLEGEPATLADHEHHWRTLEKFVSLGFTE
ncbi:TIGR03619 family F420-dependent LLM class oxidoreductase [Amycolatopsis sp. CA-230715]|uniref:TIGR03619 family F420-dependent LLM class oxidoreductase n=1 Tax=Amycolatopsis sp. CA-230715 TaxID=2745196 RepID=UPI001C018B66|nr:TIGR03619 family F420-dependent LLM class oxidoreductase [Amycolatopsis sp. CA-230715]QWF84106.1 Alkanesulfonate monooxygenase [Amycolatopsis sp. CA-230715]